MKIHAPLLPLAFCLALGIVAGEFLSNWTWGLIPLLIMLVVTALLGHYPRWQSIGIGCCVILIGTVLSSRIRQQLNVEWPDKPMVTETVVISEPVIKEKVIVADLLTTEEHSQPFGIWPSSLHSLSAERCYRLWKVLYRAIHHQQ